MVAGTGNEEIAVAMMKLGAIDYITKKAEFPVTLSVVLQRYIRTSREQRQQHIWSWVLLSASALLTLCAFTWGWQYHVQEEIQHHRLQVVSDMVSSDGRSIVVLGPDGKICEWADSMETLLGWKWDEVKGCTPDFMMTTDNACRHKEAFKKAMELETPGAMAAVAEDSNWSLTKIKWSFGPFVPGDHVAT